jgi:hypothetical protein
VKVKRPAAKIQAKRPAANVDQQECLV